MSGCRCGQGCRYPWNCYRAREAVVTGGRAATNTLRERLQERDGDGKYALALVEAALDAAADIESKVVDGPEFNLGELFNAAGRLAAALRAVREGA